MGRLAYPHRDGVSIRRPVGTFDGSGGARHARAGADPTHGRRKENLMIRRLAACVALIALVAGACGNNTPVLTDPKDIVARSVGTLQTMKSFHLHATISGTIKIDLLGTGNAIPVDLKGTTADADVDFTNGKAKATLSAQSLFLNADLVYVGTDAYYKVSLLGPKFKKLALADLLNLIPGAPMPSPSTALPSVDPSAVVQSLRDSLGKLTVPPVKEADEKIGDQDCYKVTIKLTQADLAVASPSLPPGVSAPFNATIGVWVRKSDLRPAQVSAAIDAGDSGNVTLTLVLSNIDAPVVIDPPPADQVEPAP
jgi:hypothetical protein